MKYLGPAANLTIGSKTYHPGDDVSASKAVVQSLVNSGHSFDETDEATREMQEAEGEDRRLRRAGGLTAAVTVEEATKRLERLAGREDTGGKPKGEGK